MADQLRQISLVVDTDTFAFQDFAGRRLTSLNVVNGDTVLFAFHFQRLNSTTGVLEDLDLSADGNPLALRFTCRQTRDPAADLLTFQDVYNQGDLPANEDLAAGKVTYLVSFNSSEIDDAFTAAATDELTVWLEATYLSAGNIPQTLAQANLEIKQQLDSGAVGSPPPTSPTYSTAAELAAAYLNRDNASHWAVIDKDLTVAPGAPSNGDVYIVGTGATGTWSGHDDKIAFYYGSTWYYHTPVEGWTAYLQDENLYYLYGGASWAETPLASKVYANAIVVGGAGFTVNAEGGGAIVVDVQLKDAAGVNLSSTIGVVRAYLSDNLTGDGLTATAPDGGVAGGANGNILNEEVADKIFLLQSEDDGTITVTLTESGSLVIWYLVLILGTGKLAISAAITFA